MIVAVNLAGDEPKLALAPGKEARVSPVSVNVFLLLAALLALLSFDTLHGQNIVEGTHGNFNTANPAKLTETDFSEFIGRAALFQIQPRTPAGQRVAAKLEAHLTDFIDGFPFLPFHHTPGISGYEAYFDHSAELFYTLSIAVPLLPGTTADKVRHFLERQIEHSPPYQIQSTLAREGKARESYTVPADLRHRGKGKAGSAFGVYAFWAYGHYSGATNSIRQHWPAVVERMRPLLDEPYRFDIRKTDYSRDESQKLNGDLAGLVGLARLAVWMGDSETTQRAAARGLELLELRVNLDRVNPKILERTTSATKSLHNLKLARYCDLVPEVGFALRRRTDGLASLWLRTFREERHGWYLAFGDRLIGGENYTNPPHFPRALFAGAVFVEQLGAEQLLSFVDVPWCRGDLYFVEKCVYALWAEAGGRGGLWAGGAIE